MTKKELITELLAKGVTESKTVLEKKTVAELTAMLEGLSEVQEEPKEPELSEEDIAEGLIATEELLGKSEFEVVAETIHQLGIFTEFIYNVRNAGAVIEVTNLGSGDVYVDVTTVVVGDKTKRLLNKESGIFEGASTLHLMAASQPEVKITEMK